MALARKPLVIYKAGETDKGSEAVRSHTSALAGDMALYKAAFEQLNVIRGTDFAQMADLAYLSGFRQRTGGKRIAVVTISGAMGAIIADKLIGAGLDLPTLSQPLQQAMREGIPDYGMVSNPIDVTGNVVNSPEFVRSIFTALAQSDEVDVVIVCAPGYLLDRMADMLVETTQKYPRLFVALDTGEAQGRARLSDAGVPVFDDIGRAMQALAPYCHWLARQPAVERWAALRAKGTGTTAAPKIAAPRLNEHDTKKLLGGYGVPTVQEIPAVDADAAAAAAASIGYPVALKILSADVAHKTEAGGVRLNVANEAALRLACSGILSSVQLHEPTARIDGFLVQPMAGGCIAELIAGVTNDPVFGPALTVGLGGILTELYRDASHRLLPVDAEMAGAMLRNLKAWPLLDGFRGRPKADVEAGCDAIAALSNAFNAMSSQAQEIEINPLHVRARGEGAVALDALLILQDQT